MGRLFTYMVKAAAGQQPAPYTGYYGAWGNSSPHNGGYSGVYELPFFFTGGSPIARANAIDRLFSASQNVDSWNALAGNDKTNWGTDYLTAVDRRFTSPEAVHEILSANKDYLEAIRHFANTGSYDKLDELNSVVNHAKPNYIGGNYVRSKYGIGKRNGTDYDLADGVGNAQLVMNMYLAEEARRKKDEEARKKVEEAKQPAAPQPTAQPAAAAPKPATAPVQAPAIPEGTSVVTGTGGKKYISSNADRKAQTAAGIGAALETGQNPFTGVSTTAPGASGPTKVTMDAGQAAVRNQINSNIASGQSMYSNMGDVSKFMTKDQRKAMNAATNNATHYENSGLRMVGHSADGKTQTYVGRSGRGRITVGARDATADAAAGHYRGAGAADTNPRSNYTNLRQPATTRPVTPPPVRPKSTASRQ